jgi:hypothetical protein
MGVEARGGGGSVRPFYSTTGKIGALIPSDGYKVACLNGLDQKKGRPEKWADTCTHGLLTSGLLLL